MSSTEKEVKPAILAQTGTTSGVSLAARPQPQTKKSSLDREQMKRQAAIRERKLKQERKKQQMNVELRVQSGTASDDRLSSDASSASLRLVVCSMFVL